MDMGRKQDFMMAPHNRPLPCTCDGRIGSRMCDHIPESLANPLFEKGMRDPVAGLDPEAGSGPRIDLQYGISRAIR